MAGTAVIELFAGKGGAVQFVAIAGDCTRKVPESGGGYTAKLHIAESAGALGIVGSLKVADIEIHRFAGFDGVGDVGGAVRGIDSVERGGAGNGVSGQSGQTLPVIKIPVAPGILCGPSHKGIGLSTGGDFAGNRGRRGIAVCSHGLGGRSGAQSRSQIVKVNIVSNSSYLSAANSTFPGCGVYFVFQLICCFNSVGCSTFTTDMLRVAFFQTSRIMWSSVVTRRMGFFAACCGTARSIAHLPVGGVVRLPI